MQFAVRLMRMRISMWRWKEKYFVYVYQISHDTLFFLQCRKTFVILMAHQHAGTQIIFSFL